MSATATTATRPRTIWIASLITLAGLVGLIIVPILVAPGSAAILIAGLIMRFTTKDSGVRAFAKTTILCSGIVLLTAAIGAFMFLPVPWNN